VQPAGFNADWNVQADAALIVFNIIATDGQMDELDSTHPGLEPVTFTTEIKVRPNIYAHRSGWKAPDHDTRPWVTEVAPGTAASSSDIHLEKWSVDPILQSNRDYQDVNATLVDLGT